MQNNALNIERLSATKHRVLGMILDAGPTGLDFGRMTVRERVATAHLVAQDLVRLNGAYAVAATGHQQNLAA